MNKPKYTPEVIINYVIKILQKHGVPEERAQISADVLV